jgi:DNA-binding NarL/FixJ family response regulator
MNPITVLLAEDHMIVREGLRALLKLEDDIEVVGEAENGRQAVELVGKLQPQVVVMDIAMPLLNGMEATRQILHTHPDTKILILSAHSDDAYVALVMAIGASGYLIKQTASHVLPEAIRLVHQGKTCFSPIISKRRNHQKQKSQARGELPTDKVPPPLSSREMEVLQLIAEGKANKETAEHLRHSRTDTTCHRHRHHREQCAGDDSVIRQ